MWFERLDLMAFGHFTDVRIPLGRGFHILFGPNEAGKSTTLRAIRQLLFGFDERTRDNFLHQNTNLRVGALIRHEPNIELDVVRRKSRKDSLRRADETLNIDGELWQQILSGIDEATFLKRYGINYDQLVEGGREIATGTGDLGEILFATGAGVSDLTSIQRRLDDEAGELFRPLGKKQRLNQSINEWHEQRDLVSRKLLLVSEWENVDHLRQQTQIQLQDVLEQLTNRIREKDCCLGWQQSLPLVAEQTSLFSQLSELGAGHQLPAEFATLRREAQLLLEHARSQEENALRIRFEAESHLASLAIDEDLLNRTDEVTRFIAESVIHERAHRDRQSLNGQLQAHKVACQSLLAVLDQQGLKDPTILQGIDREVRTRIHQLGLEHAAYIQALQQAQLHCDQLNKSIGENERRISEMPPSQRSSELSDLLVQLRIDGDLEAQYEKVLLEIEELSRQERFLSEKLGSGPKLNLRQVRTPSLEEIEIWESELDANRTEQSNLKSRFMEFEADYRRESEKLESLRKEFDVPSEGDLHTVRTQRNTFFDEIRRALASNSVPAQSLVKRFEEAMIESDRLVDRLRNEAERVAQCAELTADLAECETRRNEMVARSKHLDDERTKRERKWIAQWPALQKVSASPRELRAWISQRELLLQNESQIARRTAEATSLINQIRDRRSALARVVTGVEHPQKDSPELDEEHRNTKTMNAPDIRQQLSFAWDHEEDSERYQNAKTTSAHDNVSFESQSLREMVIDAEEQLKSDEKRRQTLKDAEETRSRLRSERSDAIDQLASAQLDLDHWQQEWNTTLSAFHLATDLSPDAVYAYVETCCEYSDRQCHVEQLRVRIDEIDREIEQFKAVVKQFCSENAIDLAELETDEALQVLRDRLLESQRNKVIYNEQMLKKNQAEQQIAQAHEWRIQAREVLSKLCQAAGLSLPDFAAFASHDVVENLFQTLKKLEFDSQKRTQLEEALDRIQKRLLELAGDTSINDYVEKIQSLSPELLETQLREVEFHCQQLETERDRLNHQLGGFDGQLKQMDGGAEAAEAEEKQRQLLARIRTDAEQYARCKLASSILCQAIERYRDKTRGPILSIASELFREMTLDSFHGLRIDEGDNKPVLLGIRSGGRDVVSVDGMSEGTCDQLYLALRIASLMSEPAPRNQLPFIVDDILIQFDDVRSVAALRVLARLSQQRQVIFFTHHEHLLDLARTHLTESCTVHRLNRQ